jgi:hypothetical protein
MNAKVLVLPLLGAVLIGCEGDFYAERPRRHREVVVVERPAQVVVVQPAPVAPSPAPGVVAPAPAPLVVEEGATVGNVVVIAPATVDSYILIDGEWYYWHPGFQCWVHAHRGMGWRPGPEVRIYRGWSEHPMYRHR